MAGKKKKENMDGGIFGLIPSYENKNINDIATKIINGKKEENKMKGFRWINSNHLRAEQRIDAFFKKLHEELRNNLDETRIEKLSDWFKKIIDKYPDKIEKIIKKEIQQREKGTFYIAYNFFKKKYPLDNFTDNPQLLKYLKNRTQHLAVNEQNVSLNSEFNILNAELLPNKTGMTGIIELSNDEKEKMSIRIAELAKKIYDKAITLESSRYLNKLVLNLQKLYFIYKKIFIDDFREHGQNLQNVKGVANNKKRIAINLRNKNNELKKINMIKHNEQVDMFEKATYPL